MLDGGGDDTNAKLIITSGDATFSDDGRKISGKGVVRARLEWNDDPNNKGIAVSGVVINGVNSQEILNQSLRKNLLELLTRI